jgi:hypothetical protein
LFGVDERAAFLFEMDIWLPGIYVVVVINWFTVHNVKEVVVTLRSTT